LLIVNFDSIIVAPNRVNVPSSSEEVRNLGIREPIIASGGEEQIRYLELAIAAHLEAHGGQNCRPSDPCRYRDDVQAAVKRLRAVYNLTPALIAGLMDEIMAELTPDPFGRLEPTR
jgi:hypothetical protein